MVKRCYNRLIIIGPARAIEQLTRNDDWLRRMKAKHVVWLELFPQRQLCEFTTDQPPLVYLRKLSLRWPTIIFLLSYEYSRTIGLVKAVKGKLEKCEIQY